MPLFIVMLPLVNYLLFVTFARRVKCSTLALYTVASMVSTLAYLLFLYPPIAAGDVYVSTLGN